MSILYSLARIMIFNTLISQILVKAKNKQRSHPISSASGFKSLVRGVARRSHSSIARQALANVKIRRYVLSSLRKYISKEMKIVSSKKHSSILRGRSVEHLKSFSWETLEEEIKTKAPTLYGLLCACVRVKRKTGQNSPSSTSVLGVCAAILLRNYNQNMNLLQRIVALILHSGRSSKQVS